MKTSILALFVIGQSAFAGAQSIQAQGQCYGLNYGQGYDQYDNSAARCMKDAQTINHLTNDNVALVSKCVRKDVVCGGRNYFYLLETKVILLK